MRNTGSNKSTVPSSRAFETRLSDYDFYIPDVTGDNTGLAFCVAYNALERSRDDYKESCTHVASMLCSVVPEFRNSIEKKLNGLGIRPHFVSLPSQACENNIVLSNIPELDRSSILVIFGYCILCLFKVDNELFNLHLFTDWMGRNLRIERINELRETVGCPNHLPSLPFEGSTESSIANTLGTHSFRGFVINFLFNSLYHPDPLIGSLCQYLSDVLCRSSRVKPHFFELNFGTISKFVTFLFGSNDISDCIW